MKLVSFARERLGRFQQAKRFGQAQASLIVAVGLSAGAAQLAAGDVLAADCAGHSVIQCDIAAALDGVGDGGASVDTKDGQRNLVQDDSLILNITSGKSNGYLSLAYITADDELTFIMRDAGPLAAHTAMTLGDGKQGKGSIFVSPPFGGELAVVLTSPTPLLSSSTPQTAAEFLEILQSGRGDIHAAYLLLQTRPEV